MLNKFEICEKYIEQYSNLDVCAKANCISQYLNMVIPYDADELKTLKEIEGSIFFMLADEQYAIDKNGNWLCEGKPIEDADERFKETSLNQFVARNISFTGVEIYVHCKEDCNDTIVAWARSVKDYDWDNDYADHKVTDFLVCDGEVVIFVESKDDNVCK